MSGFQKIAKNIVTSNPFSRVLQSRPTLEIKRNNPLLVLAHVLAWTLFFVLPFFVGDFTDRLPNAFFIKYGVHLFLLICVFYLNTQILIPKLLFKRKIFLFVICLLGLIIIISLVDWGMRDWLDLNAIFRAQYKIAPESKMPPRQVFFAIFSTVLMLALGTTTKVINRWWIQEKAHEQARSEKLATELAFLKNQVNPHFFFNTLNNIYSLTETDPEQAQQAIHRLSKLMRYLLYETDKPLVPIDREIRFMEDYIELMKMRLSDDIKVEIDFSVSDPVIQVPPLLLVPLIENCFKHGVSYEADSWIKISLRDQQGQLVFSTENTAHAHSREASEKSGLGLENIQRRLKLLFEPDQAALTVKTEHNIHFTRLTLPVHDA